MDMGKDKNPIKQFLAQFVFKLSILPSQRYLLCAFVQVFMPAMYQHFPRGKPVGRMIIDIIVAGTF